MKEIIAQQIIDTVAQLCIDANLYLPSYVKTCIYSARKEEPWEPAQKILGKICENITLAETEKLPLCQDTGMVCVFLQLGQEVHINGMGLYDAINEGVRKGYTDGYLRKSIVKDPLNRDNTGDNTPAMITTEIVDGENLQITVLPKGFGSENMSRLAMLSPSDGVQGVIDFVVETAKIAASNPCPPIVLGVGIGGSFDKVALLAKKAMARDFNVPNHDSFYAELEHTLLQLVNQTGIGPQGFGGKTTALKVNIETLPTHIAGLPVAVNVNCHVTRRAVAVL